MSYLGGTRNLHHGLQEFKMFKLEVGQLSQDDPEVKHAFKLLVRKFEREHIGKVPTKKQMEGILKRSINKAYSLKFKKSKGGNVKVKYAEIPLSLQAEPLPYHERFPETFSITQRKLLPYYTSHLRQSYKTAPYVFEEEEIEGQPFETKLERAVRKVTGKLGRPTKKEVFERDKRNEFLRDIESHSLPKKETGKRSRKTHGLITSSEHPQTLKELYLIQQEEDELRRQEEELRSQEEELRRQEEDKKIQIIEEELGRTLLQNEEEVVKEILEELAREELDKKKKMWKATTPSKLAFREHLIEFDTEDLEAAQEKFKTAHDKLKKFNEEHSKRGRPTASVEEERNKLVKAQMLAHKELKKQKELYGVEPSKPSKSKKKK